MKAAVLGLVLLIVAVVVTVGFLLWLAWRARQSRLAVENRDLRRSLESARGAVDDAYRLLAEIERATDLYHDIDSPLAAVIRPEIRKFRNERWEIDK